MMGSDPELQAPYKDILKGEEGEGGRERARLGGTGSALLLRKQEPEFLARRRRPQAPSSGSRELRVWPFLPVPLPVGPDFGSWPGESSDKNHHSFWGSWSLLSVTSVCPLG